MAEDPKIDPQKLNRDWEQFIQNEDPNHRLDSPEEAQSYAQQIDQVLTDKTTFGPWAEKYGEENLKAWGTVFKWFGEAGHFQLASKWKEDARQVRNYLKASHLYEEPTVDLSDPTDSPSNFMGHHIGQEVRSQRYYNQPPSALVEEKIVKLCAAAGGGEKAIGFIKELKTAYPEQFNAGGLAPETIPFFDGRIPLQLARGLKISADLVGRENILPFMKRVDKILDWEFSFQTANTYLRFHDQWQKEGEGFFQKLKIRRDINQFIKVNGLESEIDEGAVQKIVQMEGQKLDEFWKFVSKNDIQHFFLIYGSEKYDPPNLNHRFENGSPGERLEAFIALFNEHGSTFFEEIHQTLGFSEKVSLDYLPLYQLSHDISQKGPLKPILEEMKDILVPQGDRRGRNPAISTAWGSQWKMNLLANTVVYLHGKGILHSVKENLKNRFEPRLDFNANRGKNQKDKDFLVRIKNFDLSRSVVQSLIWSGSKVDRKTGELQAEDLNDQNWPGKFFWASMAQNAGIVPASLANGDPENTYKVVALEFQTILYEAIANRNLLAPTPEEIFRLEQWTQRMVKHNYLKEDPTVLKFLLWNGVLTTNLRIPTDTELAKIEQNLGEFKDQLNSATRAGYTALVFLCKVRTEVQEKAPQTLKGFTQKLISSVQLSENLSSSPQAIQLISTWENGHVLPKFQLLEEQINTLAEPQKSQMMDLIFHRIGFIPINQAFYEPESFLGYLDSCHALLKLSAEQVSVFLKTIVDAGEPKPFFKNIKSFQSLFDFFQIKGPEELKKLINTWSQVGLAVHYYDGNEAFLNLSPEDTHRLQMLVSEPDFELSTAFARGWAIIKLNETDFTGWKSFYEKAKAQKISFDTAYKLKDLPHLPELIELLWKEGIFKEKMTNGPDLALNIYARDAIPILARHFETTKEVLAKIKSTYGDFKAYMMKDAFQEFGGIVMQNDEAIIGQLARIVAFEAVYKQGFFSDPEEITVWGSRSQGKRHPAFDEGSAFDLLDFPFWAYGPTTATYPRFVPNSREDLEQALLKQFSGLTLRPRKNNKSYSGNESVSIGLLKRLPLSKLLKIQWLLNNLEDPAFQQGIQAKIAADLKNPLSEHGGYVRHKERFAMKADSPVSPLELIAVPSAKTDGNKETIAKAEALLAKAKTAEERESIKEAIEILKESLNGEYVMPEIDRQKSRGAFFNFHLHSTGDGNDALYAGPSLPDLKNTEVFGDGLVITPLEDGSLDVDYYFSYPIKLSDGSTLWKEEVIDLGVYSQK